MCEGAPPAVERLTHSVSEPSEYPHLSARLLTRYMPSGAEHASSTTAVLPSAVYSVRADEMSRLSSSEVSPSYTFSMLRSHSSSSDT